MKGFSQIVAAAATALVALVLVSSAYVIDPTEQVIITQFGNPVGDPIREQGLHFRVPFIQEVNKLDRRVLEWDGVSVPMQTKDKLFIQLDSYARWQIEDPLQFFRRLRDERSADSRLDDILAGETLKAVASNNLVEVIRSTNREIEEGVESLTTLDTIQIGRSEIESQILAQAGKELSELGIRLLDIRFKRVNYKDAKVIQDIHLRMASERKQIAEQIRSEGDEEASGILGKMDRELKEIESGAYRRVQEIQGEADAEATKIYAEAFNQSAEASDFYEFVRTMEVYTKVFSDDTTVVLSTDSDLFQFLKGMNPEDRKSDGLGAKGDVSRGLLR